MIFHNLESLSTSNYKLRKSDLRPRSKFTSHTLKTVPQLAVPAMPLFAKDLSNFSIESEATTGITAIGTFSRFWREVVCLR